MTTNAFLVTPTHITYNWLHRFCGRISTKTEDRSSRGSADIRHRDSIKTFFRIQIFTVRSRVAQGPRFRGPLRSRSNYIIGAKIEVPGQLWSEALTQKKLSGTTLS